MGSIGPMELFVVLVIALLVFGPKKLPEIGRGVGSAIREFKRHSRDLMSYLEEEPEPRRVYPETTPSLRPVEPYAEPSLEPIAAYPETPVAEEDREEEPAPVLAPSPTPSNTHPMT